MLGFLSEMLQLWKAVGLSGDVSTFFVGQPGYSDLSLFFVPKNTLGVMSSSNLKRAWPFIIVGGAVCVMLGWSAASILNEARRAAEGSAQLALFQEAEELLEVYQAEHGHYPKSLDSLEFSFPDGGDRSTLALLKYQSDGKTYSLGTKNVFSGEELRVSR